MIPLLVALSLAAAPVPPDAASVPKSSDPRLVVELFAAAPDIVHPVALDFDAKGRLLVVESHTHFRPANYAGPKFDRIRAFDPAGKATTFFEGTTFTMDLAVHPSGDVYVATRNEVLRLRDTDADGVADKRDRIAFLETAGNYPHNGLSGLSFDGKGGMYFGIGENLGAGYKLVAADGSSFKGGGEGGNVFWCTTDGGKLRRVATGFWNPFGTCRDSFGRVFVVDNDPDASPPCRLLQLVEGADYGYQFRYGRSGRHPFQAWNGELPGTLPQVAGTGESPCEVVAYEGDGLPAEYLGNLLVPAWADHRVERYVLKPKGAGLVADRLPFVQGGKEFRPSGLAVAPDGSLFVSDWVSRSYELHGKGAIWHIKAKDPKSVKLSPDAKRAALAKFKPTAEAVPMPPLPERLRSADPYVRHAAVRELATLEPGTSADAKERVGHLLALRMADADATKHVPAFLADADPDVRFLAVKWVADEKLTAFRPLIEKAMANASVTPREMVGLATALARIDDKPVNEDGLAGYFAAKIADTKATPAARMSALRAVPGASKKLTTGSLVDLLKQSDPAFRVEALRALKERGDAKAVAAVRAIAVDPKEPVGVRAQAVLTLSALSPNDATFAELEKSDDAVGDEASRSLRGKGPLVMRPKMDVNGWLKRLEGPADADTGRRVFEHPRAAGCFNCHRVEGRGADVGPDLSLIGRTDRRWIVESLVQPSASVAPHYQAWKVETTDGRVRTGLLVHTNLDESTYLDEKGGRFKVLAGEVEGVTAATESIMPANLVDVLTDQEIRDLVAYLASRK